MLNKAQAMMIDANVPYLRRYKIVQEAVLTATKLDGLIVVHVNGKEATRYEQFGLPVPKFVNHMRTWGEAGVVKTKSKPSSKLTNKGSSCMFVGYADNHSGNCYRMWEPMGNYIYVTRDVLWLKRMFFNKVNETNENNVNHVELPHTAAGKSTETSENTTADANEVPRAPSKLKVAIGGEEITPENENEGDNDDEDQWETPPVEEPFIEVTKTKSGRTVHPIKCYQDEHQGVCADQHSNYYNVLTNDDEDDADDEIYKNEALTEIIGVGAGIGGGFKHSRELKVLNYKEAMASEDRKEWENEIKKEHQRMKKHKVWKAVPKSEVPKDVKPIATTWAFKKKSSGDRRGRLNAHGFKQQPDVHFKKDSISSPVTNEVTIRVVLVIMIVLQLLSGVLDVKGAFLQGEFEHDEEQIYLIVPDGLKEECGDNILLKLLAPIYGLRNASMAFYRKLKKTMESIGCKRSLADPCLYYKWGDSLVLWLSWTDDCMHCGKANEIKESKKNLMKKLDCEDMGELNEHVGSKLERKGNKIKMTQPALVQSLEDEFQIPSSTPCNLPAPAGKELTSNGEPLSEEEKKVYRSGVGKLLFLMRYSRPDILNAVRELSKFMSDGATIDHRNMMRQTMNYVIHTKNRGLCLNPVMDIINPKSDAFKVKGRSDSNYATNVETRKSVSGLEVTLNNAPVVMRSIGQKIVALSVTEAELIALAQVVQEMLYVMRLLESIGLKVQKPMVVQSDNKGAIDLCNSWTVGGRTKHIDTRYYFLREMKEQGIIIFEWISGKKNTSDLFTKNLPNPMFTTHTGYFCTDEDFSA